MKAWVQDISAYIKSFSGEGRRRLTVLYHLIKNLAPESEESISYGMPAFKLGGRPLVYFAGYEYHLGLYALPSGHARFTKELAAYKQGKGSVQFPHSEKLPVELIKKIVRFRVSENLKLAKSKPVKKSALKTATKKSSTPSKRKNK